MNGHVEARVVNLSRGRLPLPPARTYREERTHCLRRNATKTADSGDSGLPLGHKKLFVHVYVSYAERPHGSDCQRIPESKTTRIGPKCENMDTFIFPSPHKINSDTAGRFCFCFHPSKVLFPAVRLSLHLTTLRVCRNLTNLVVMRSAQHGHQSSLPSTTIISPVLRI